jgi:6-phosphogluconolactonase
MSDNEPIIFPDPASVAHAAASLIIRLARESVDTRGRFSLALSGGSTPGALYRLLATEPHAAKVPWPYVHLFWGDERCVPPDDPGSNYNLAYRTLISEVPIPDENVHRVPGELEPDAAALAYESALTGYFCGPHTRLDLILLGLGADGHTASLFPGSAALEEKKRLALPVQAMYQDRPTARVTLTLPAINAARNVLFLVTGESKAGILATALGHPGTGLPAQLVRPVAGQVTWLLDAAAAAGLVP